MTTARDTGEGAARPRFPFSAVVASQDCKLALVLAALDPGLGGVLLRGDKGTAKTTLARGLAALLPGDAPFAELPLGASEERLTGSLDLAGALAGEQRFEPGVLAAAHGGVLYVDEVNLLADHLVDVLLDVAASGRNVVEREGISHVHPARFVLVGSMNPEEGELRPQLLDRFGLAVEVTTPVDPTVRALAVRRRVDFDADPRAFAAEWAEAESALAARLAGARPAALPDALLEAVSALCAALGAQGLRADLAVARAAAALAGWEGRTVAGPDDVARVAPLALAHRRRRGPFDAPRLDPDELADALDAAGLTPGGAHDAGAGAPTTRGATPPATGHAGGDPADGASAPDGSAPDGSAPDGGRAGDRDAGSGAAGGGAAGGGAGPDGATGAAGPDGAAGASPGEQRPPASGSGPGDDGGDDPRAGHGDDPVGDGHRGDATTPTVLGAAGALLGGMAAGAHRSSGDGRRPTPPPRAAAGRGARGSGATTGGRGRVLRAVPAPGNRAGADLAVAATAVAAARRRAARPGSAPFEPGDARVAEREERTATLVVVVLDTSGSMGARDRLAAVTGALLGLLADAYRRRAQVALVTFGGEVATTVLRPTGSVEVARARLADVPVGGPTPLAAGIREGLAVATAPAVVSSGRRAVLVVCSDGRATAATDGDPLTAALDAAGEVALAGVDAVVLDCEYGPARLGLARRLADEMGARHIALDTVLAAETGGPALDAAGAPILERVLREL